MSANQGIALATFMRAKLKTSNPDKVSITVVIDGIKHKVAWGENFFPVEAGHHSVTVYWVPLPRKRRATVAAAVSEGETTRIRYNAPTFTWQPGTLEVE
jgi:hypothetical protein